MGKLSASSFANLLGEDSFLPYDSITPPLAQGSYRVKIEQQLVGANNSSQVSVDPLEVWFRVEGTTGKLSPTDVLACYPPDGARDVPVNFLCHITLKRKTLPWERHPAGAGQEETPWLAVLLLAEGEYTWSPTSSPAMFDTVNISNRLLATILPGKHELKLLAHARKLTSSSPLSRLDDDGLVAIVLGNRLPEPGKRHRACLINVDSLWDKNVWPGSPISSQQFGVNVSVLYSWTFQAGQGGDFEGIIHALRDQGGVHPFGVKVSPSRLPGLGTYVDDAGSFSTQCLSATGERQAVRYRLPLVSTKPAQENLLVGSAAEAQFQMEDGTPELGCASAFELGRIMTLTDPEMLSDLLTFRRQLHRKRIRLTSCYQSRLKGLTSGQEARRRGASGPTTRTDESDVQQAVQNVGRGRIQSIASSSRFKQRKMDFSDLLVACSAIGELKAAGPGPVSEPKSPEPIEARLERSTFLTRTVENGG